MSYDWFSGHNQGVSLGFNIDSFMTIWGLYSYQQAFQFQRFNRETASQINALWDYKGHYNYKNGKSKEHLVAVGVDFKASDVFRVTPYLYYVTNAITAPGLTAKLTLGKHNDLYSATTFKYTYMNAKTIGTGQLFVIDQEFGYGWFRIGGGYYKTTDNGVSALTAYGDDARFYGGILQATYSNKAAGEYFGAKQSTWYIFTGARHNMFKFDILYANGGYKELSTLVSIILFQHLDFGVGYVDLANVGNDKRNFLTAFIKAIW